MSQPRLAAVVILGITTVTAAGLAYHHYQRAEALTRALAAASQFPENSSERMSTPESSPTATASEEPESVLPMDSRPEETEILTESPTNNRGRFDRAAFGNRMQALMADPEYAHAFQQQQRARLDGRYADLFAQLNLPPATLSKLQDLLVEKQNAARDVFMAAREEGLGGRENRDQLRELVQMTQAEIDAQIQSTIGDQNYAALKQYEETGPQRVVVERLESRLSYSSTPLNAAQAQALTMILSETAPAAATNRAGSRDFGAAQGGVTITDDTITRAQAVLSADQLQSLVTLQAEQAAAEQIADAMRREARTVQPPDGG